MSARNQELLHQMTSGPDISLDDWLNMVSIFRERRNRMFGADLFLDPAMAIFAALGRDANRAGLPLDVLSDAAGVSPSLTRRWLMILIERRYVEELEGMRFKLTADARARLQEIYS